MAYFVIEFLATINGNHFERGKIGSVTPLNDCRPNKVKNALERHFRSNPNTKSVAIVLNNVKKVSSEEYFEEAKTFIELGSY